MHLPYILFPLLYLFPTLLLSQQINLTRSTQSIHSNSLIHTIPFQINKQQYKIALLLNQSSSWIKSNKCLICKQGRCRDQCNGNVGGREEGLVCGKGYCIDSEQDKKNEEIEGMEVKVNGKIGSKSVGNVTLVNVDKIKFETSALNKQYDGVFGLLNSNPVLKQFGLVWKDKKIKLILKDSLPKQYLDSKQQTVNESLEDDYYFKVSGFTLDNEIIYIQYKTYLSLTSKSLLLPQPCYEQMKNKLKFLFPECQIENNKIACKDNKQLNALKDTIVGIQLQNSKLQIPLSSLTDNCKTKECDLLIQQSKQMKMILGEGFLLNYGVTYNIPNKTISFHRLDNTFSSKYYQIMKVKGQLSNQHQQFPRTVSAFIWHFMRISFKIGIVLGLYYFMLQFYLNYKDIIQRIKIFWFQKQSLYRSSYTPANQDEFYHGGSLIGSDAEAAAKEFWEDNAIEGI